MKTKTTTAWVGLLGLLFSLTFGQRAEAAGYQMPITFGGYTNKAETLTNFPVLVVLSNNVGGSGFNYSHFISANGWDLRFRDAGDTVNLNYEIESWNTNGASYVWLQAPTLAGDGTTAILAKWGDAAKSDQLACTTNGAVWANGFTIVGHLAETVGTAIRDSTANHNNGTANNGVVVNVAGKVGQGEQFDGTDDYTQFGTTARPTDNFTFSAWIKTSATHQNDAEANSGTLGTVGQKYAFDPTLGGGSTAGAGLSIGNNGIGVYEHSGSYMPALAVYGTAIGTDWNYVSVVYIGRRPTIYLNGAYARANYTSAKAPVYAPYIIGGVSYGYLTGFMDEARVSGVSRSTNWVWAEYVNMASNGMFNAYGAVASPPAGAPEIANVGAANVQTNSADMIGNLTTGDAPVTVVCYWGTNNGGYVASAWMTNTVFASQPVGPVTNSVANLIPGQTYSFCYYAANSVDTNWAAGAITFTTPGPPMVDNGSGADGIGPTNATLNGTVLGGNPTPNVWIYWGTTNGGANKGGWDRGALDIGPKSFGGFLTNVTGLLANQTNWYRCYASNVNGEAWASAGTNFVTAVPSVAISPATTNVAEGMPGTTNPVVFTVSLSDASAAEVTVSYTTSNGTATVADNDYVAASGSLAIPPGVVSTQLTVQVIGDNTHEANETFSVTLSSPVGATPGSTQCVVTILNDDLTYYVRHGGAGAMNGSDWANAYAQVQDALNALTANTEATRWTVRVQASTNGQSYNPVSRNFSAGSLHADFEGGWENVDTAPTQTAYSVVKDTNGPIDQRGFNLEDTTATTSLKKYIGLNRFRFSDVTDGVRVSKADGYYISDIWLTLRNTDIQAESNGVVMSHIGDNGLRMTFETVTIHAGHSGAGQGIWNRGEYGGSTLSNVFVTSAGGSGVLLESIPSGGAQTLQITDSTITNCLNDGIRHLAANEPDRYSVGNTSYLYLNRVKVTGNGTGGAGNGIFMQQNAKTGSGRVVAAMVLNMSNVVAAGNAGSGVYLDGVMDVHAAKFAATLVNCTVANNASNAVYGASSEADGSSVTVYNTILSGSGWNGIQVTDLSASGPAITEQYNDFHGNVVTNLARIGTGGTNYPALHASDLAVNPSFVFAPRSPDPYRLPIGSVLLNAGSMTYAPPLDLVRDPRPEGAGPSMGAYEKPEPGLRGTAVFFL